MIVFSPFLLFVAIRNEFVVTLPHTYLSGGLGPSS
jgi:hypothetical protein